MGTELSGVFLEPVIVLPTKPVCLSNPSIHGNSPSGLRPHARACIFHRSHMLHNTPLVLMEIMHGIYMYNYTAELEL